MADREAIFRTVAVCAICALFLPSWVFGLAESTHTQGSNVWALQGLGFTGQGLNVGLVAAGNALTTHQAFRDANDQPHAFAFDFTGENTTWTTNHDTWMAGIVVSRGSPQKPDYIGVAPGADIYSAKVTAGVTGPDDPNRVVSFTWVENALEGLVNQHNCRVIVTGIAFDPSQVAPDGLSNFTLLYDYYAFVYDIIFANAAGNDPEWIVVFGDCYNGITTGGLVLNDPANEYVYRKVGSKSGSGPTDDGRRKPELTGPSQNQTMPHGTSDTDWYTWTSAGGETSFSAPHTAGVAASLLSFADTTAELDDGRCEVIKAVMINSAFPNVLDRAGNPTNPANPNNVWHQQRGYGRVDALRAYQILAANRIEHDQVVVAEKGWAYAEMTKNYEQHYYYITGRCNHRLVLTITWSRQVTKDVHGTYRDETAPRFNLDLTIKDPNGQPLFNETGTLDNLEKVDLVLPRDGIYEIAVKNTTSKKRNYALAFELLAPLVADFNLDYVVNYADLAVLADQWLQEGAYLKSDLWPDDKVDLLDYTVLAGNWLLRDARYCQQD